MTKVYCGHFESPIGIIEIITSENAVLSAMFVETGVNNRSNQSDLLTEAIGQFEEYFSGVRKEFDVPYMMKGTDFQQEVWEALSRIPYGDTMTYKELASEVGNEKAVRAVGHANGRNVLSIMVPCHRVIGSNKHLTGYAGGLHRKQWLIEFEARFKKCSSIL
ncbi:methylated-DNA--[protein]-cysteine S-methyltransferase [Bacillus timonensis]|nr:methylated-DNA--[protein]-cysteine S-methyltransferase [Bacillus timonensis]